MSKCGFEVLVEEKRGYGDPGDIRKRKPTEITNTTEDSPY